MVTRAVIDTYKPSLSLVRRLLAARLHLDEAVLTETDRLDDLGLTPLDVALVVLRLHPRKPGYANFPIYALSSATTVGHLAQLVELWLQRGGTRESIAASEGEE
jgi:hypothetical protein